MNLNRSNNRPRTWTDDQLLAAVPVSRSIAGVCRLLGLRPTGGNHESIKRHIERLALSTDHFTGQGWNTGKDKKPINPEMSLEMILVENSEYSNFRRLKKRLIEAGMLVDKCYKCDLSGLWMEQPITLQLEHKNGNNRDHRLENLELLCPNCHSQTSTFAGRNKRVPLPRFELGLNRV